MIHHRLPFVLHIALLAALLASGCHSGEGYGKASVPAAAGPPSAATVTELPAGKSLLAGDPLQVFVPDIDIAKKDARIAVVDAKGPGFSRAWRVDTMTDTVMPWHVDLTARIPFAVRKGDVGIVRFFARALKASDETGKALVEVTLQGLGGSRLVSHVGEFPVGREWQEIFVPFEWLHDLDARDGTVGLRFGYKRQSVEVGGITAVHYGRSVALTSLPQTRLSYPGREPGAAWRQQALDRIERVRKSDISLHVADASGRPVKGASVRIEQTRSAFQWGTALDMKRLVIDTPDNLRYREVALELFNSASTHNDLKWSAWERGGSEFSHAQTLAGLRWLREHGFHTRGHVLVWPAQKHLPSEVRALFNTPRQGEIPGIVLAHIHSITRATKGLLDEWDVLNEPYTNHELMDLFGDEIMVTWFKAAREELPHAKLYLNDFSNDDAKADPAHVAHFERTTRFLLDHGAPLDGLGMQGHFSSRPNAPENIVATLDRYQKEFNLPVRFTEFDIPTSDEQLQADFTRDFLIAAFSHPSVVGVQHWGFWEGRHWKPPAAMFRTDWSEKPNAKVYKDLVLHQWRTNLTTKTNASGQCTERGFHGDYRVTIMVDGRSVEKTFSLAPDSNVEWRIVLPE